ncbi:tetratricopeptide repeat protein [Flavobacterium cyanobacteriorum]|uniref:tetratricopeptide repeat protein n=1 Tax=Flavobacterium cyanobacteriorum TaxID=2022802 RepID=UPI0029370414|nr:tetratricopeptide repeat protein [Flavobacterium cyanobacteriorum]
MHLTIRIISLLRHSTVYQVPRPPTKAAASYNLGNAIYRQNYAGEALYAYSKAITNAKSKTEKHMAYHNLGNTYMKEKKYQAAVEAYKNALRNNPYDEETRYNYALAKKMLKDNPPPPEKQDKNKDKQKDKNQQPNEPKDQQNKDSGKDNEKDKNNKGDQKDKGQDEKEKQDKSGGNQEQQGQASPSKQRMENLLDAMDNEEKKVQDKVNASKAKSRPVRQEKDW